MKLYYKSCSVEKGQTFVKEINSMPILTTWKMWAFVNLEIPIEIFYFKNRTSCSRHECAFILFWLIMINCNQSPSQQKKNFFAKKNPAIFHTTLLCSYQFISWCWLHNLSNKSLQMWQSAIGINCFNFYSITIISCLHFAHKSNNSFQYHSLSPSRVSSRFLAYKSEQMDCG
jgi:hypothetical protein